MNAVSMLEQLQGVAVDALAADPMFSGAMSANTVAIPIILGRLRLLNGHWPYCTVTRPG